MYHQYFITNIYYQFEQNENLYKPFAREKLMKTRPEGRK